MPNLLKKLSIGVAGLAALALGGAALAGATSSSSTSTSTAAPETSGSGAQNAPGSRGGSDSHPGFPSGEAPGTPAHENAEKPVTGEAAEKAKAAALKAVPGKAGQVTTDFRGAGYEVDVTKANGTKVTVHLDKAFRVMAGPGGPHGPGGPGRGGWQGGTPPSGSPQQAGPPPGPESSAA